MIVVTGAGGFIGSVVLGYLNSRGIDDIAVIDNLPNESQYKNLVGKQYKTLRSTEDLWFTDTDISAVVHMGANSSTLEKDWNSLYLTNVKSTRNWNQFCKERDIPFIFTSSAAVYGNGQGPLNQYAFSKQVSEQEITGAVLRLFNVYGPNEYHKGRMASTVFHWYDQLESNGVIKIFKNSSQYFRDFVYVEDVAKIIYFLLDNYQPGIYDLGSGHSVSFDTVADTLISEFGSGEKQYIDMPDDLQKQYQSNTKADLSALHSLGYNTANIFDVKSGIKEYCSYLKHRRYY